LARRALAQDGSTLVSEMRRITGRAEIAEDRDLRAMLHGVEGITMNTGAGKAGNRSLSDSGRIPTTAAAPDSHLSIYLSIYSLEIEKRERESKKKGLGGVWLVMYVTNRIVLDTKNKLSYFSKYRYAQRMGGTR